MSQPLWKFLLSVQNIALMAEPLSRMLVLAVEDQFYLALPFFALSLSPFARAIAIPCLIVFGGIGLRAFLAAQNPSVDGGGVSFRAFKRGSIIRPDPAGSACVRSCSGAIEKFRPNWWQRLINAHPGCGCRPWANRLRTVSRRNRNPHRRCMRLAIPTDRPRHGRATCLRGQSPLPLYRVAIPGAAFIASIAYSAYLIQKRH